MRKRWSAWLIVLSVGIPVLGQAQTPEERREAIRQRREEALRRRQERAAQGGQAGAASTRAGQGGTATQIAGGAAGAGGTAGRGGTGGTAGTAGGGRAGAGGTGGRGGAPGIGGSGAMGGRAIPLEEPEALPSDVSVLRATRAARRIVTLERLRERWGSMLSDPRAKDELKLHARRVAELQRVRLIAEEKKRTAALQDIDKLLTKEELRHSRVMNSLRDGALPSTAPTPTKP